MNQQGIKQADLTRSISCAAAQIAELRATFKASSPADQAILQPLICKGVDIIDVLERLKLSRVERLNRCAEVRQE